MRDDTKGWKWTDGTPFRFINWMQGTILSERAQAKTYGLSDVMQANYVDDVIYYVTLGDLQYGAQNFQKNTPIFISYGISA